MRITPFDPSARIERQHHVRGGKFRYWALAEGEPGTPHNFSLQLGEVEGDFFSPRHRHNFDQIRFQVEGDFDFSADGQLEEGEVGYFPEGVRYGPQKGLTDVSKTLTLQFGGASGQGYMPEQQYQTSAAALRAKGTFADGIFTWYRDDGSKVNQDAYEAVWEHAHGRPLTYPRPRFAKPLFMKPANFDWREIPGQPGVQRKHLATLTEVGTTIQMLRLEAGCSIRLEGNALYFVWQGECLVEQLALPRFSVVSTQQRSGIDLKAISTAQLLHVGMPAPQTSRGST